MSTQALRVAVPQDGERVLSDLRAQARQEVADALAEVAYCARCRALVPLVEAELKALQDAFFEAQDRYRQVQGELERLRQALKVDQAARGMAEAEKAQALDESLRRTRQQVKALEREAGQWKAQGLSIRGGFDPRLGSAPFDRLAATGHLLDLLQGVSLSDAARETLAALLQELRVRDPL